MADERLAALRPLLRERIEAELKASPFPHGEADVREALDVAAERVEAALGEVLAVALRPVLRRLEQSALDKAGRATSRAKKP